MQLQIISYWLLYFFSITTMFLYCMCLWFDLDPFSLFTQKVNPSDINLALFFQNNVLLIKNSAQKCYIKKKKSLPKSRNARKVVQFRTWQPCPGAPHLVDVDSMLKINTKFYWKNELEQFENWYELTQTCLFQTLKENGQNMPLVFIL